jgi:catechol 2,3-dioxygenase-like lactoylglutathione lyase family enzyme
MAEAPFDSQVTFLATTDLAQTAQFYEQVIGLRLALDQGTCRIYQVSPGGFVGFCQRDEATAANGTIVTFVTEDVDGWCQRLRERGVSFEKEPTYNPQYRIYHCFLRDPNGYLLEIQRFDDPRWQAGERGDLA